MKGLRDDIFGDGPWYAALNLAVLAFGCVLSVATFSGGCGPPKSCARYGTLEAEYGAALQEACGKLDDVECAEQRPNSVKQVDERFRPQFEEAERCQIQ